MGVPGIQAGLQRLPVGLGLGGQLLRLVGGAVLQAHVHLGDVHLQAQRRQALYVGAQLGRGGRAIQPHVHLQAHSVDGDALLLQPLQQAVNGIRLFIQPFAFSVIVDQQRLRVGLAGPIKSHGDVLRPDGAQPMGIAQLAVGLDGLVDHVPGVDLAAVVPGNGFDVPAQDLDPLLPGVLRLQQPGRLLQVPDQYMGIDLHTIGARKIHDRIPLAKVVALRFGVDVLPLHLVPHRQQVELLGCQGRVGWVI